MLDEKQIRYGWQHVHTGMGPRDTAVTVAEAGDRRELNVCCTQLEPSFGSDRAKKQNWIDWCDFLSENTEQFTELWFHTRLNQELFNAVCKQKNLRVLWIKWGSYPDISAVSGLQKLEFLHIGSGSSVESVEPLAALSSLQALSVENFQKVGDYSALTALDKLESLEIMGDGFGPRYIHIDSLRFLASMPQLRFLRVITARLKDKDVSSVLTLKELESLCLDFSKEVKASYDELIALPKLKYGLLLDRPDLYK
jgi:hypothetical protein